MANVSRQIMLLSAEEHDAGYVAGFRECRSKAMALAEGCINKQQLRNAINALGIDSKLNKSDFKIANEIMKQCGVGDDG